SLIYHRKGLDEETKKTFSRETLIAMILDLSPETPPETLEGMEDQELRDLLNQLLAELAPPISPWGVLAVVGGLGVLGVGAAVAVAMATPVGRAILSQCKGQRLNGSLYPIKRAGLYIPAAKISVEVYIDSRGVR
ncbi:unnamed protein product, partial [marine sediment metagenome]